MQMRWDWKAAGFRRCFRRWLAAVAREARTRCPRQGRTRRKSTRGRKLSLKTKASSPWPMILMIGGGVLLLFLICGGVLVFSDRLSGALVRGQRRQWYSGQRQQFGGCIRSGAQGRCRSVGLDHEGQRPQQKERRRRLAVQGGGGRRPSAEVAAALENTATNPSTHDAAIRGLATWAGPDDARRSSRRWTPTTTCDDIDKGGGGPADASLS